MPCSLSLYGELSSRVRLSSSASFSSSLLRTMRSFSRASVSGKISRSLKANRVLPCRSRSEQLRRAVLYLLW